MANFTPVSSNKLYVQIYNQLRDSIMHGNYKVGDKLPSEKELSQMFNVSRVPVREALCALELAGYVESMQGVGVYVKEKNVVPEEWTQNIAPQEIILARITLEPEIARQAAMNISDEEKTVLQQILNRFKLETEAETYSSDTDRAFHECIVRASGNSLFATMMDIIYKAMEQNMWKLILHRTITTKKYRHLNFTEHVQIGQAIISGNADEAFARMKEHMENLTVRYWE